MKIAVIDTSLTDLLPGKACAFLPELIRSLTGKGNEVHLISREMPPEEVVWRLGQKNEFLHHSELRADVSVEESAPVLVNRINKLNPDVFLIWTSEETGWTVLPQLHPDIATVAVGHADSETFYAPVRHYRSFLTRVVGTTPEVCVGFVLGCVIEKERVEWISHEETETGDKREDVLKLIETYENCFAKAIEDAHAAPREAPADFPPMKTSAPHSQSWFSKLIANIK